MDRDRENTQDDEETISDKDTGKKENTYSQREWDRTVGYGKVPPEYAREEEED